MSLGKTIKERREACHMTQEELAEKLNVSRQAVSKWESDLSVPAQGNLQELCKLLDMTLPEKMEEVSRRSASKLLWAACVTGWVLVCVLGILLGVQARRPPAQPAQGVSAVRFYDSEGHEITSEANWYALTASTIAVITYAGEAPDAATVYLTPSGSETFGERKQLAVFPGKDDQAGYILVNLTFAESMMGHLQVALDYGNTSIFSNDYNVLFD